MLAGNAGQQRFQEPLGAASPEPPLPHTIGSLIWLQTLAISVSLGCFSSQVGVKLFSERLREAVPHLVCAPLLPPYCQEMKGKGLPRGVIINLLADLGPGHPGNGSSSETHPVIRKPGILIPATDAWFASAVGAVIHQQGPWPTFLFAVDT